MGNEPHNNSKSKIVKQKATRRRRKGGNSVEIHGNVSGIAFSRLALTTTFCFCGDFNFFIYLSIHVLNLAYFPLSIEIVCD